MPSIDEQTDHLCFKIVFCGPGCSGKSTALRHIYASLRPGQRGDLVSLPTDTGRTLFFDFLPIHFAGSGQALGKVRFHLYTAPGQVFFEKALKLVLRDADGVVFVADSQAERQEANREALRGVKEGLAAWDIEWSRLPAVFLYNKRDTHDRVAPARLKESLNPEGRPEFEAVATEGHGVLEMLETLCDWVLETHLARSGTE